MPRGAREMNRLYRSGKYRLLRKTASSKIGPLPLLISLIGGAQSSSTPLPIPLPQGARGKKPLNSLASYLLLKSNPIVKSASGPVPKARRALP